MFNKLNKGDIIGVIAPSSPIMKDDLEKINKSILLMEGSGYNIKFSKNAFRNTLGYGATPKEKAEDINEMFADKEVKLIFCVSGGFNSNSVFEYLDYDIIKNKRKKGGGADEGGRMGTAVQKYLGSLEQADL